MVQPACNFVDHYYRITENDYEILQKEKPKQGPLEDYINQIITDLTKTKEEILLSKKIKRSNTIITLIIFGKALYKHLETIGNGPSHLQVKKITRDLKNILTSQIEKITALFTKRIEEYREFSSEKQFHLMETALLSHHAFAEHLPKFEETKTFFLEQLVYMVIQNNKSTQHLLKYINTCAILDPEHLWLHACFNQDSLPPYIYKNILNAIQQYLSSSASKNKNIFILHFFCKACESLSTDPLSCATAKQVVQLINQSKHFLIKTINGSQPLEKDYSCILEILSESLPLSLASKELSEENLAYVFSNFLQFPEKFSSIFQHFFSKHISITVHVKIISALVSIRNGSFPKSSKELAQRIIEKYMQLAQIKSTAPALQIASILYFAFFIEIKIPIIKNTAATVFTLLSTTLLTTASKQNTYILLNSQIAKINRNKGTFKQVHVAVCLPENTQLSPFLVACSENKPFREEEDVDSYKKEISFHHKINNKNRGIWPLLSSHTVPAQKLTNTKIFAIMPLATGTLYELSQRTPSLSLKQRLEVSLDIAKGLKHIHSFEFLHGDLSTSNILYETTQQGTIKIGLIDFGMSCPHKTAHTMFPFKLNKYGVLCHTPLELLSASSNFSVDLVKVELWSLGCLFYNFFIEEKPLWAEFLSTKIDKVEDSLDSNSLQEFENLVDNIEKEYPTVVQNCQNDPNSVTELTLLLCLDLCRKDPNKRISLAEVILRIEHYIKLC